MTAESGGLTADRREFELPLASPLSTAGGGIETREGTLIRVKDEGDGDDPGAPAGVGEATPLPGWTESLDACRDALDAALDRLETDGPDAALDGMEGAPAARHGLSLALLDREARAAGEPLYRHLRDDADHREDGRRVDSVPVNATVGDGRIMETVAAAREAVEAGFTTLKVKVGARETAIDAGRVEAIRSEVPGDLRLRVDANGAWSRREARLATGAIPDVEYVEQPLAAGDLAGHAGLRDRAAIALDETLAEHSIAEVIEAGAGDVVVLKPMVLGGVDRAFSAATAAREAGIDPVITTTVDGVVARTAAVHLAAALEIDRGCGLATARLLESELAPDPAPVSDGEIAVPAGPGNGVSVAWTGE